MKNMLSNYLLCFFFAFQNANIYNIESKMSNLNQLKFLSKQVKSKVVEGRSVSFDKIYNALVIYKQIYGDLFVPQRYVIPENDDRYPEYLHGLKLGIKVKSIRAANQYYELNQSSLLDRLGFEWSYHEVKKSKAFERDLIAINNYKNLYGNYEISKKFTVPDNSDLWPEVTWGLNLGDRVYKIKQNLIYTAPKYRKDLKKIQSHLFIIRSIDLKFSLVYDALLLYKEKYQNLLVPMKYVVPSTDNWPSKLWGLCLGQIVANIRAGSTFSEIEKTALLDKLGFVWDFKRFKFEFFITASMHYHKLYDNKTITCYSDIDIPILFTIENLDYQWPECFWGYKLGGKAYYYLKKKTKSYELYKNDTSLEFQDLYF